MELDVSVASGLGIILVSVGLIAAVLHDYRLLAVTKHPVLLRLRLIGVLLVGFGTLGWILDAEGYGGTGPTVEVDRRHGALGNVGSGYEEGSTWLGKLSSTGWLVGLGRLCVSSAMIWSMGGPKGPTS
jgi:hypothetical protein